MLYETICSHCSNQLLIEFEEKNTSKILYKLGKQTLLCRACAKNRYWYDISRHKRNYVFLSEIRKKHKNNQKTDVSAKLDNWM